MYEVIKSHKEYLQDRTFAASVLVAVVLFCFSMVVNYGAGTYATSRVSNAVTDIFLDNLPVVNVDIIYTDGALLFWIFVGILLIRRPQRIPFVLKSIALFVLVRSLFITLTHIAPFPEQAILEPSYLLRKVMFGGDLFFSGHTGLPFLMSLVFWNEKRLRWIFLVASIVFGASALLGHIHYSIDVFAAFFITYSIYSAARKLFPYDARIFERGLGA